MPNAFTQERERSPLCHYSQEEMIAKVREAEAQVERGEYITDEELSKEIETWFR